MMKIRGKLDKIMIKQNSELYGKYATIKKGQPVIYMKLLKVLYGLLLAAVFFYKNLIRDLTSYFFFEQI